MSEPIALIVGHIGKPDAPSDPGAVAVAEERYLNLLLAAEVDRALRAAGLVSYIFADGSYRSRAERADSLRCSVHLHLHADSQPSRAANPIGALFYHPSSPRGRTLAETLAAHLAPVSSTPIRARSSEGYDHARALCGLGRAPSLVVEAYTVQRPPPPQELSVLAAALARGLRSYLNG